MKKKLWTRLLAFFLSAVMVTTCLPLTVFAVDSGGDAVQTITVAKAELGTDASFGGERVDLSNALYTFEANGTGYTISATVPDTENTVYLNIGDNYGSTNAPKMPNMASPNGTPVALTNVTVDGALWFRFKDSSSLHFHRDENTFYFNRCGNPHGTDHDFALFRAANEGEASSEDIPGYVRITAADQVTAGDAYLIAAEAQGDWYVLYPASTTDVNAVYVHVAKVVKVEEEVEVTEPENPGEDDTTVRTPQDAIDEGYDVHYFVKYNDTSGNGWTFSTTPGTITIKNSSNAAVTDAKEITADAQYRLLGGTHFYAPFNPTGDPNGTTNVTGQNSTYSNDGHNDFKFVPVEDTNGGYKIQSVHTSTLYMTGTSVDFTHSNKAWKGIQFATEGETFYITPANDPNDGTYWIWYQTEKQTVDPEPGESETPDPVNPGTQTYASPADAEAAGKVVKYFGFNYSSRYWTVANNTTDAHCAIHLYQAADNSTATTASLVADTDGVDNDTRYVLITDPTETNGMGVLHYGDDVTNQCRGSGVSSTVTHAEHLFVIEAVDGGYSIRANGTTNKYLSLDASGSQRAFKTERTVFYITPAANPNDGTYYIWTANDPQPGDAISEMFATTGTANWDNTWAFVGGRAVQGSFDDIGLARTLAGQFEEYIRWQNRGSANDEDGVPQAMQRYVTNTAYTGQTLNDVVSSTGWERVTALDPKAVVYMVGTEDAGSQTFANDLKSFIDKSLALRDGSGFAVIIKGYDSSDLNAIVDTVVNDLTADQKSHVVVVDGTLTPDQLTNGYPNAKGHLELARKLAAATVGSTSSFPTVRNDAAAIENGTWANKLTDNGVTIFGETPETLTAAQQAVKDMVDGDAPMTWLFMGDSITHGALWAEGDGTISQNFEKFVKDDLGRTSDIVINTAVSGATSVTTVREIEARLNKYDPDVVSIMIGTNDAAGGRYLDNGTYKNNLQTIVNAILAKGAIAVLRTPIPDAANERGNHIYKYVDVIWEVYNGLTPEQQAKVIVVDQFAEWTPYMMTANNGTGKTFLFGKVFDQDGSGIHPGPIGHLWMTQELINGLGLWDSEANICKLSYQENWGITGENSTVSLADVCAYDADSRTLSVPVSSLALSGTVISVELTAEVDGETYTASYLRGQDGTLTITFPEGADSAEISAVALVSESASAGKKVSFASAAIDLSESAEPDTRMPAPAEPEAALEYRRTSGELAEGTYAIVGTTHEGTANAEVRVMHPWYNGSNVLKVDQCKAGSADAATLSINANKLCGTGTHLFTVTKSGSGYIFQVGFGNAVGKYLAASASGVSLSDTATVFTVTEAADGGYYLSWNDNGTTRYVAWGNTTGTSYSWKVDTTAYRLNLYRETEVPLTMAQTEFKGTTNRPTNPDDPGSYFRIPSLTTLSNGWIMAAADIRWYSTNDSPNNLDTIVSISKDGGQTWDYEVVNYFADYAPIKQLGRPYGPAKGASASFIDPSVVQTEDGTIWLLVDLQPPYVNGGKIGNGFDSKGRLLVGYIPGSYSMNNTHDSNLNGYTYDYYADINNAGAGQSCVVNDESVTLWPICSQDGDVKTGYYVDAFFNTYYDYGEDGFRPVIAQQHDSSEFIHNNLFYTQSDWKAFPTAFIMARSAQVAGDGLVWSDPMLLNAQIKHDNEHFIGVCPGRGVVTTVNGNERIVFPLYDNQTGNELASVIYSDDQGATWHRGEHTLNLNGTGKTSESQIVVLPVSDDPADGTFLRMYSRNGRPTISYVDSHDGGQTWGTSQMDTALNADNQNGQGCMVSFINVAGCLVGPDGTVYEHLVMASYPQGTYSGTAKRTNGTVRIGYYDPAVGNGPVTWLNEETVRFEGSYIYSCLTQRLDADMDPSENFALLYETDRGPTPNAEGNYFTDLLFTTFTMTDLLGEDWTWLLEKPTEADVPTIDVIQQVRLVVDGTRTVVPSITPETAVVTWESSDENVATVDSNGVITAVGVGEADIIISATNSVFTTSAIIKVVVVETPQPVYCIVRFSGEGVSESPVRVEAGSVISLPTPEREGYTFNGWIDDEGNAFIGAIEVIADVTLTASWTEETTDSGESSVPGTSLSPVTPVTPVTPPDEGDEEIDDNDPPLAELPFIDVDQNAWYAQSVASVHNKGLMNGMSDMIFAPKEILNRGMMAQILHNIAKNPAATAAAPFADLNNRYYTEAVAWGAASGILKGYSDTVYGGEDALTREQMAAMLYRYVVAQGLGQDVDMSVLDGFVDSARISGYAKEAVAWAVENGLLQGRGNNDLDPRANITRAEVAAVLDRYAKLFLA